MRNKREFGVSGRLKKVKIICTRLLREQAKSSFCKN
jgi:hypothetical protein